MIDIVRWNEDMHQYLESALSPAKVGQVITNDADRAATVVVPDNELSLAIGRRGQNVRLAARLTGWRIDIRSQTQWSEEPGDEVVVPADAPDISASALAEELGVSVTDLADIAVEESIEIAGGDTLVPTEQAGTLRALLGGGDGTLQDLQSGSLTMEPDEAAVASDEAATE